MMKNVNIKYRCTNVLCAEKFVDTTLQACHRILLIVKSVSNSHLLLNNMPETSLIIVYRFGGATQKPISNFKVMLPLKPT